MYCITGTRALFPIAVQRSFTRNPLYDKKITTAIFKSNVVATFPDTVILTWTGRTMHPKETVVKPFLWVRDHVVFTSQILYVFNRQCNKW